MAIHTEEVRELQGGFGKEIEASALTMIYDNLQKHQYQYPEKSTIRELASNAVDSTKEKFQALEILKGSKTEEDYYIRRDEAMFRDSNFDRNYFNPLWLGKETQVYIDYMEGGNLERDKVVIRDQGVGLGGKRLDGYFKLGWSSKRNNKQALGKFGIGAKAGLSTGVDYYTVISRYNGQEFKFNVYSHKVDSVTPHINTLTGQKNEYYIMYEGTPNEYKAYWTPTMEPNGVTVILEVKKHKKQQYLDAVKSQLLYFDNIHLNIHRVDGYIENVPTKATILYEDDHIIVSDNNQYSKPHLVINKVNYGYVDFQELELEQKMGNVGIKVAAEEVSVNPSRESVIWNEQTKATIQTRFKQAAGVATKLLQQQLSTTDFLTWLRTWSALKRSNKNGGDVVSRLAGIVDINGLEPTFMNDSTLRAGNVSLLFPGISVVRYQYKEEHKGGKKKRSVSKSELISLSDFDPNAPVYITGEKPQLTRLRYLSLLHRNGFYVIRYPEDLDRDMPGGDGDEKWIEAFSFAPILDKPERYNDTQFKDKSPRHEILQILTERRKRVVALLNKSLVPIHLGNVLIPDDFSWTENDGDEIDADVANDTVVDLSPEEKRRLEQRVVAFTPRGFDYVPQPWYGFDKTKDKVKLFEWQKIEPKLMKAQSLAGEDIYYGTSKDEAAMHLVAAITSGGAGRLYGRHYDRAKLDPAFKSEWGIENTTVTNTHHMAHYGPGAHVTLLKVAQDQVKHYTAYKHINAFFLRTEGKTITMSTSLIQWHTARLVDKELKKLSFLKNYAIFNRDKADVYKKLVDYHTKHYINIEEYIEDGSFFAMEHAAYTQLVQHHEKVMELQLFVRQNPDDKEAIANLSKTLFSTEFEGATGIDLEIFDMLQDLKEYASSISTMLNAMPILTEAVVSIDEQLEAEIRSYIAFKGL